MPAAYRDETDSLLAKNRALEEKLAEREREIEALRARVSDQEAVFDRLENVLDAKSKASRPKRFFAIGGGLAAAVALLGTLAVARSSKVHPLRSAPAVRADVPTNAESPTVATNDVCATPGVKLTVDGHDVFSPATEERDRAGHKYRRGGSRSPWFTVNSNLENGPVYVHGYGDFLAGDLGTTSVALTIMVKGETDGYAVARGGKSMLEITRSDGKLIAGRFEADMSKVSDTTREPPFGTPVIRVRGSFCLPAHPADPSDTKP
jgi:hypothetical protein